MRTLIRFALCLSLLVIASAPAAAVLVDTSEDMRLSDLDSTVALRSRIEPMLAAIEVASNRIAAGDTSAGPWDSIREAARDGIATALDSAVRECSKDYWAMTYTSFGLYYLATTRMLESDEPERAYTELATAMNATNLTESAYRRAIRDCGQALAGRSVTSRTASPPALVLPLRAYQPAPGMA